MDAEGFFDPRRPYFSRWGSLPHWRQDGALYFVTFRLSDSIPAAKMELWEQERTRWFRLHPEPRSEKDLSEFEELFGGRLQRWLDRGYGSCLLRMPCARDLVEGALRHFDGKRYELREMTIAGNHVHVLVRMAGGIDLSEALHSWKSFTGHKLLGMPEVRSSWNDGPHLWQSESFDHIVRNRAALERYALYIQRHSERVGEDELT